MIVFLFSIFMFLLIVSVELLLLCLEDLRRDISFRDNDKENEKE